MMRWIVGSSLASRRVVLLIALALGALGAWQYPKMSAELIPEFTPPTVVVQTEALGLSAAEVEQLITVPLEQDLLNGVAFLDVIRSESVPGLSAIELIFERGTPLLKARQVVAERLTQAHALPQVSKPPQMLQPLSSTSRVMMVGLSSKQLSAIDLSVLARWTIRPKLMGVPGVASVAIFGQREQQLQVQVDPVKLRDNDVSLDQVIRTAGNALWVSPLTFLEASTPGSGGFIDTPNQRLGIQHVSPINTPEDLAQVTVDGAAGRNLKLGDVATIVTDHQPLIGDAVFVDGPGLLLVIEKFPGVSTLDVTERLDAAFEDLRPGLDGVDVDPFLFRPQVYVDEAVDNLTLALVIGALFALGVLLALTLDWRSALVSAVAVAASVVAGWFVLFVLDATINAMVVAGLVLGLLVVVDDAVLGAHGLLARLRAQALGGDGDRATLPARVRDAVVEARRPFVFGTAIIAVTLLPLLVMDGLSGDAFFPPVALTYGLAALASMVVALTVVPALGVVLFSRGGPAPVRAPVERIVRRGFDGLVSRGVLRPLVGIVVAVLTVGIGIGVLTQLDASAVPSFDETDLLIDWQAAPGTSITEMRRLTALANEELRNVPGVLKVGSHVGRAISSDQVVTVSRGELWVRIDGTADYGATRRRIESVLAGYPGVRAEVLTYSGERLRAVLSPEDEPIDVRLFGEDLAVLQDKADEVRTMLAGVKGIADARVEAPVVEPTLAVKVDLDAAAASGIKPGDVRRAAATLLSGIEVGALFEQQKVFEVVVKGTDDTRHSLSSIRELLIDGPSGKWVRLGDVADVQLTSTPQSIRREASTRALDVVARVSGRSHGAVARDVRSKLAEIEFPLSHHAELLGGYDDRKAAEGRVLKVAIGAAVGVLLLLQAAFGSWRLALLVLVLLPLGVVGGLVTAAIDGQTLTIGSIAGLLGLLGLTARRCVLLVKRYQALGRADPARLSAAVQAATSEQLVPTVTSTLVTAVAFAPFLFLGSMAGGEIVKPLAVVVVGGLVTSALVALVVLPALAPHVGARPGAEETVANIAAGADAPPVAVGGS